VSTKFDIYIVIVSSNPAHGEVYAIQHYVIKFLSDMRQVGVFSVYSTNKTNRHDITEILLRVVLNTITLTLILKSLEINNQIENQSHGFFVIHKFSGA
jgi:hypothetical protein